MKKKAISLCILLLVFLCGKTQPPTALLHLANIPEYKILFVHPQIVETNRLDTNQLTTLSNSFGGDIFKKLSTADKFALGIKDTLSAVSFCQKYVAAHLYKTLATAQKSRLDSINIYRKKGFTIYSITADNALERDKAAFIKLPQKINEEYKTNSIAEKKKWGKKNFYPAIQALDLNLSVNSTLKQRVENLKSLGYTDVTQIIKTVPKNHYFYSKTDNITGKELTYEIACTKDEKVYQLSLYIGQNKASVTLDETKQMNGIKSNFQALLSLIDNEVGGHSNFMTSATIPFTEDDLLKGTNFFKGINENKIGYWANWISVDKKNEDSPIIFMEIYPNKKIKITVTDTSLMPLL